MKLTSTSVVLAAPLLLLSGNVAGQLIPDEILEAIPEACQGETDDSEFQATISCVTGNLLQCSGLLGVMDEFNNLIPASAEDCGDITGPFCTVASKCEPCKEEFDILVRCIADNLEPGTIDQAIIDLVDECPLTCDGNGERLPPPVPIDVEDDSEEEEEEVEVEVEEESEEDDAPQDIPTTAAEDGRFDTLVAALDAADLVETLSGEGPFTVFAPTDRAFAALPEALVPCLLRPENKEALASILTYHVASGRVASGDLSNGQRIPTVQGDVVVIGLSDGVKVNDATVVIPDVEATNGIIHVIDAVLVPPSVDVGAFLATCPEEDGLEDIIGGSGLGDLFPGGEGSDIIGDLIGGITGGGGFGDFTGDEGGDLGEGDLGDLVGDFGDIFGGGEGGLEDIIGGGEGGLGDIIGGGEVGFEDIIGDITGEGDFGDIVGGEGGFVGEFINGTFVNGTFTGDLGNITDFDDLDDIGSGVSDFVSGLFGEEIGSAVGSFVDSIIDSVSGLFGNGSMGSFGNW